MKKIRILFQLTTAVILLLALLVPGSTQAATAIFINELHYDNSGADADEAIEIAGPAGTDLGGWSLALYNGNGGTVYATIDLSGTIPNQQAGCGTLSFAHAGIQNGSPDGMALVDSSGSVVQFLSYEGSLTAVDGPATGMNSSDIGVEEPFDTPVGFSLQLNGSGSMDSDFVWNAPTDSSFGTPNEGQTFACGGAAPQPNLLLTEVVVTPTGGEFIEIHNPGSSPIDLSNVYLTDATFAGGATYYYNIVTGSNAGGGGFGDFHARFPTGATIGAGEYQTIALAGSTAFATEYGQPPTYELFEEDATPDAVADMVEALPGSINNQGGLTNDGEVVILYSWDGESDLVTDHDYLVWGDKAEAVDKTAVSIDGPDTDTNPSTYQNDTPIANQEPVALGSHAFGNAWQRDDLDEGSEAKSGGNGANGHDETSENSSATWCDSPPTPNAASVCGGLVISEIMYNPLSLEDDWEWVELYNSSSNPIDLTGYVIDDNNATAHAAANINGGLVGAGETAVLFNGDDLTATAFAAAWGPGNYVPVTNWGAMALNNGGDQIGLWDSFASYSGDHSSHANAIADVAYGSVAPWPASDGSSSIYLTDLAASASDGANWALSGVGVDTPTFTSFMSAAVEGNSGGDIGSPSAGLPSVCGDPATLIHTIQGSGLSSGETGNAHTVEAVVIGDYQDTATGLRGFYLQEEDGDADGDPATSEGIFVFDNGFGTDVAAGDLVRVTGIVTEFGNAGVTLTELVGVNHAQICSSGHAVTPTTVSLPVTAQTDWEAVEGMLVTFEQTLTVTEHFTLGRFGEVVLSSGSRLYNPTHVAAPGAEALAVEAANDRNRIILDDASTRQNPDPIVHPAPGGLTAVNTLRGGDTVTSLTGVLDQRFDQYRIQPVGEVLFDHANPRTTAPDPVGGSMTVASLNVLNYFVTIDDGTAVCGPASDQGCRGADSFSEFARQRDKIVNAIVAMDADVVGLVEIENHATDAALTDLVAGLNAAAGADTYAAIHTGPIGSDAIKVAFVYQPAHVTPVGAFAVLDSTVDPTFIDTRNRPALAQTFTENSSGEMVTVAVNHLKSKGSGCADIGDPDMGDGQGNCNLTRTSAATALANWLANDPTGSGDSDYLIIGDLNAYAMEDPITALKTAGYTNLIEQFLGAEAYSYVFAGEWGYLDHALANESLLAQVAGVTDWHINADEPISLDYNEEFKSTGQVESLYSSDPYRVSDHDPVLVGLNLGDAPADDVLYISSSTHVRLNGVLYSDEDILAYNRETGDWSLYFDGSDMGLAAWDLVAFMVQADGSVLMSFHAPVMLPELGLVDDSDIVLFTPTSTGEETAGSFSWFFDGSDVGLSRGGEDIDGLTLLANGRLLISTKREFAVPGSSGEISGERHDLLLFDGSLGSDETTGSWELYFDGSDVEMHRRNDIGGLAAGANGELYLTLDEAFNFSTVSGTQSDVVTFMPDTLGDPTSGRYAAELFFDGVAAGIGGERVDGLSLGAVWP